MSPKKAAKTEAEGFPTADDALEIASEWAPAQLIDSEDIGLRLGRMMTDAPHDGQAASAPAPNAVGPAAHLAAAGLGEAAWNVVAGTAPMPAPMDAEQLRPLVTRLVRAAQRVRKDHRQLSTAERERYNEVLRQLAGKPAYKQLVADHEDMSHRHHTMHGMGRSPPSASCRGTAPTASRTRTCSARSTPRSRFPTGTTPTTMPALTGCGSPAASPGRAPPRAVCRPR